MKTRRRRILTSLLNGGDEQKKETLDLAETARKLAEMTSGARYQFISFENGCALFGYENSRIRLMLHMGEIFIQKKEVGNEWHEYDQAHPNAPTSNLFEVVKYMVENRYL